MRGRLLVCVIVLTAMDRELLLELLQHIGIDTHNFLIWLILLLCFDHPSLLILIHLIESEEGNLFEELVCVAATQILDGSILFFISIRCPLLIPQRSCQVLKKNQALGNQIHKT